MQSDNKLKKTFRKGSTTYYYSSLFFPKKTWQEVATLYSFVRQVDDLVDCIPADTLAFKKVVRETKLALSNIAKAKTDYVFDLITLMNKRKIKPKWIISFLDAMNSDLTKKKYKTYAELKKYSYGSACVIGLCMTKIIGLPSAAQKAAAAQGEAMQLINFIRDIKEDTDLGRTYIPQQDLIRFKVKNLKDLPTTDREIENFSDLVRFEIDRYRVIQKKAEEGYRFIPYRFRVPIATAATLYNWTANQIYINPLKVYLKKVKPSKIRILLTLIYCACRWAII